MNRAVLSIGAALAAGMCCTGASADILTYGANLSGLNEVPPNASPASGYATITVDTVTGLYTIDVSFSGLTAPDVAAHLHGPAAAGVNAAVMVNLTGFPLGVTSGVYNSSTLPAFTAGQMTNLASGLVYINIHTSTFPGGEIRGQFALVPTPGAAALLGLGGLVAGRRRR